uniref:SH2 domain-containing protein n=1 Tax=Panagrellus redivivus TaxID=6233 RepID=A0A7E4UQN2_PANRE
MLSQATLENDLMKSGATFCVDYVGNIEVMTAIHELDSRGVAKHELASGCAVLIAAAAGLKPPRLVDPRIQEIIGHTPAKGVNKKIQLNIISTAVYMREMGVRLVLLRKIKTEEIPFGLVLPDDILENAFLFIGKVKDKSGLPKRYAFLLQSQSPPTNISETFQAAFAILDREAQNRPGTLNLPSEPFHHAPPPLPTSPAPAMARKHYENIPEGSRHSSMSSNSTPIGYPVSKIMPPYVPSGPFMEPGNRNGFVDASLGSLSRHTSTNDYGDAHNFSFATVAVPPPRTYNTRCTEERFRKICEGLEHEKWFFGRISRDTAIKFLDRDGAFLVRISGNEPYRAVLSVRAGVDVTHHVFLNNENGDVNANRPYDTIIELIQHHYTTKEPLVSEQDAAIYIKYPVCRPSS